ncbi:MAG TPA: cobalamin biosynthesis protein [Micromonosporaceae bacterium]|nr:cobalamin biosynthesis protein [Micromonosporaceae bacterium]
MGRGAAAAACGTAGGLIAGALLDTALGDPRHRHPVAAFGRMAARLEAGMYADSRAAGVRYTAVTIALPLAAAVGVGRATHRRPWLRAGVTAVATWAVLGGASLRREAAAMAALLEHGDLEGARARLPHLCGRDPSGLDEKDLARATVESVAENTSDAVVAPLCWGAVGGVPGLVAYRAINTLDAMVGHRSPRYARFGTASARLDDAANLLPARVAAVLTAFVAPVVGGSPRRTVEVWRRDGSRHPSPNAGQCEAAVAGALGVRLGGRNVYGGRAESRPELGDGPTPSVGDIRRAARLSGAVGAAAVVLTGAAVLLRAAGAGLRRRW